MLKSKIINYLLNDNAKISDRLFMVISTTALICYYLCAIPLLLIGDIKPAGGILGGAVIFTAIIYFGFKANRLDISANVICTLMVMVSMPTAFF